MNSRAWRPMLKTTMLVLAGLPPLVACQSGPKPAEPAFSARTLDAKVGGEAAVELRAPPGTSTGIVSVTVLPGRGMNLVAMEGRLPDGRVVPLMVSPPLKPGDNVDEDTSGNRPFKDGGAFLIPYANRIRGRLSKDGKSIRVHLPGGEVSLAANWKGKKPKAEQHAMHGLILESKIQNLRLSSNASEARVEGDLDAGDFGGHWLGRTALHFAIVLNRGGVDVAITALNTGTVNTPIGIGWHPYFRLPSGDRTQARLRIPARTRVLVNNYDDVFPTGKTENVAGSTKDVSQGLVLDSLELDDCFTDLTGDPAVAELSDPKARYGLRVSATAPPIRAFQVYAPLGHDFVAIEPQFNLGDPFDQKVWKKRETGMVMLAPGRSVDYRVHLELFTI